MPLTRAMPAAALALALAAAAIPVAARAGAPPQPAPYAVFDWPSPLNPAFVRLGDDHFLLSVRAGKQVWDARNNVVGMADGFPVHTSVGRAWAPLAGGTLVSGHAHTAADLRYDVLTWWDGAAKAFSAPLAMPPLRSVQALIPLSERHALACLRTYTDDAADGQPTVALLLELVDGTPRALAPTAAMRALLAHAGVSGMLDGEHVGGAAATPVPLVFNLANCQWEMRPLPAALAKVSKLRIDHRRLPDGRLLVAHAKFFNPATRGWGNLPAPLLWNAASGAWVASDAPLRAASSPDAVSSYGSAEPVASFSGTRVEFLDPGTLRSIPSAQRLSGLFMPMLAPLSNGDALLFSRADGVVLRVSPTPSGEAGKPAFHHAYPGNIGRSGDAVLVMNGGSDRSPHNRPAMVRPLPEEIGTAQFAAIAAEARRRAREEDPEGQPWTTLDRATLARMSRMPAFVELDGVAKNALIHQAGAWDLLPFDKPSDAQALWAFWLPDRGIDKVVVESRKQQSLNSPHVFHADAQWGPQAGAQVALMTCLAAPAWYVQHIDPMLWTIEQNGRWEQPGGDDFGNCVRKQSNDLLRKASVPLTERGKTSAAILEEKLGDYLLAHACSGKGPDSCLPLLHALVSLNADSARLPAIVKTIEPSLALDSALQLPLAGDAAAFTAFERVLLRRLIFVTAKLQVLTRREAAWPAGELTRSWRTAWDLTAQLQQAAARQAGGRPQIQMPHRDFANPWALLPIEGGLPPSTHEAVSALGRDYAAAPGCPNGNTFIKSLPDAFWIAFVLDKMDKEQTTCGLDGALPAMQRLYVAAMQGRPDALAPLAPLRTYMARPGAARDEVAALFFLACPAGGKRKAGQRDPWNACRHLSDNRLALLQREQEARQDRGMCGASVFRAVRKHLGMPAQTVPWEQNYPFLDATCRALPGRPARTLAALAHVDATRSRKQVFVGVIDERRGRVVAGTSERFAEDAAMTLVPGGMRFDATRYMLAPGVRAFGLDILSGTPAAPCTSVTGDPVRYLYVLEGKKMRLVMRDVALSVWRDLAGDGSPCDPASETPRVRILSRRELVVGSRDGAGYADLLVRSKESVNGRTTTRQPRAIVLRYDGSGYPTAALRTGGVR